jgi:zinc transport system ATP-binding protein
VQKDFPASVWEIVLSGFQGRRGFSPFYTAAEKEKARSAMERLGIKGFEKRCYRDLSGGQQQRVLLARALCVAGRLLLLDEPVAGLDPGVTQELYDLIGQLNRDGVTIVMISHDISAAMRYATHILHVGKQLFFGAADEYRQSALGRRFLAEGGED